MPRIEVVGIEQAECHAACAIKELAELIQDLCYYGEGQGIATATIKACEKTFRAVKSIVVSYWGDEHLLVWDPPEFRFQKAKVQSA